VKLRNCSTADIWPQTGFSMAGDVRNLSERKANEEAGQKPSIEEGQGGNQEGFVENGETRPS
jgi:hypothetical protein